MSATNTQESTPAADESFGQAARSQGVESIEDLVEKSKEKTVNQANERPEVEAEEIEFFDKETSDKLFDIAAQNQGFANFQDFAESYEKDGKTHK